MLLLDLCDDHGVGRVTGAIIAIIVTIAAIAAVAFAPAETIACARFIADLAQRNPDATSFICAMTICAVVIYGLNR